MPKIDLLVVGSIALDTVATPFGRVERALGGSATYASFAASFFAKPGIVGVVGHDFPEHNLRLLASRGIDLSGIERSPGKTFFWSGKYEYDMNEAKTIKTELNSFAHFKPKIPEAYRGAKYIFLGNIDPGLQLDVLRQMNRRPKLVVADTMNYWISKCPGKVRQLVKESDVVLFNDAEARQMFKTPNLSKAAQEMLKLDSEIAIIKKGEHGCVLFTRNSHFAVPGYPLEVVRDPTGAGDCFAGTFTAYLSKHPKLREAKIRKAMVYASAVASFNAEDFSLNRLRSLTMDEIKKRYGEFRRIVEF